LTGANIALATLGEVPAASLADSATHALSADNASHAGQADSATNATNATNASNAATLGMLPPSAFVSATSLATSGAVKFDSGTRTLISRGSLSITATCSAGPLLEVDANTTESGTLLFFGENNAAVDVTPGIPRNMGATFGTNAVDYSVVAPSGASLSGYVVEGANILGAKCVALAYGAS
jgi:hypothetical protein